MRRLLPIVAFILLTSAASPAMASIIPLDPVIGVRGRGGSVLSNSNAFFGMEPCAGDFPEGSFPNVFCLEYEIAQNVTEITSLTFQLMDAGGLIPDIFLFNDTSGFNGFPFLTPVGDGFSVRFSFAGPVILFSSDYNYDAPSNLRCQEPEGDGTVPCAQGSHIQLYLTVPLSEGDPRPPYSASLRAVNDISVPEPGLLLLMGTGLALASRRLRSRRA
jgi:hypothetical protein